MVKYNFIIIMIIILGCKAPEFTLSKGDYPIVGLRTDGYFLGGLDNTGLSDNVVSVYFIYQNGVIYYIGSVLDSELKEYLNYANTKDFHNATNDQRGDITQWGIFRTDNEDVEYEIHSPSSGGRVKSVIRYGKILNDTTFIISHFLNNYDRKPKKRPTHEVYHFRKYSPKPDSTNIFIK